MTVNIYRPTPNDTLSPEELTLYRLITDYRAHNDLPAIQLSDALTITAGRHATDMRANIWEAGGSLLPGTNLNSWSDAPYYEDHRDPDVMQLAPERLGTGFDDTSYELAVELYGVTSVAAAFAVWQSSAAASSMLLNRGSWSTLDWGAIGVGIDRLGNGRTVMYVWLSETADPKAARLLGNVNSNTLTGTALRDHILAGQGNDTVQGEDGRDLLKGEAGRDSLVGGGGGDVLIGGTGLDTLVGGAGADRFRLTGIEADRIADFDSADVIEFQGAAFAALGNTVQGSEFTLGLFATDEDQLLVYHQGSGRLWFDPDGSGLAAARLLAVFAPGTELGLGDFAIL